MNLGVFSVSLAVKDLAASRKFYEALGFSVFGGEEAEHWLIMKNGSALVGLFQGMFERNTLTFNPGWDENAENVDPFDDVRKIQSALKEKGLSLIEEADESAGGPGYCTLVDPDGNPVLIDQHR